MSFLLQCRVAGGNSLVLIDGFHIILLTGVIPSQYSATSTFNSLCNKAYEIFRRIFHEHVPMVRINCHVDNFNILLYIGFFDNRHVPDQYFALQSNLRPSINTHLFRNSKSV